MITLLISIVVIAFLLAVAAVQAAIWLTVVIAFINVFLLGYEAWNQPANCSGFCGGISHAQGAGLMVVSVFPVVAGIIIYICRYFNKR